MSRERKWVMRNWSNFDDPYFEGHLTEKTKNNIFYNLLFSAHFLNNFELFIVVVC